MTGKAEDRPSFQQQPPASGNDPENKKGLANRGVSEPHPPDSRGRAVNPVTPDQKQ
jgi:hypothetical protein